MIIVGSASANSANEQLASYLSSIMNENIQCTIYNKLKELPAFDPELSTDHPPAEVVELRQLIEHTDGIIISSPEYIFSIPAGLKNLFEWCVATTIFDGKPAGVITASANGTKAHEEIQLILKTLGVNFVSETTLLVQGVRGKINREGIIINNELVDQLILFKDAFTLLLHSLVTEQS